MIVLQKSALWFLISEISIQLLNLLYTTQQPGQKTNLLGRNLFPMIFQSFGEDFATSIIFLSRGFLVIISLRLVQGNA